jgi:protein O-mannosyl-transferase
VKRSRSTEVLASGVVACAAVLVFANSLLNGFAYDDVHIIENNARVHQLADQAAIWLTPYWPNAGEEAGLYRPFAIFWYALQWQLGGGAAWVFHAVSIALHAAVSLLVLRLLLFFVPLVGAIAGGVIFAVHPVHTETVANTVGQAELIAACAALAACVLHARRPPGADVSWPLRFAHVLLFLVAVLAKESAIVLPGLLLLVDVAQRRMQWSRAGVVHYLRSVALPLFLVAAAAAAYLLLRLEVLGSLRGVDPGASLPYLREAYRLLTALRAWPEFVRLMFFPLDLSADYGPAVILPMTRPTPMVVLGAGLLLATMVCAMLWQRAPLVALAAAWFLVSIVSVSNLIFPIGVLIAERTLYTPSVAVAFLAGAAAAAAAASPRARARRLAVAALAVGVVAMGVRTWVRNPDWKDTWAVLASIQRDRPEAYRPYWSSAASYTSMNALEQADPLWRIAYYLWPRDPLMLTEYGAFLNRTLRFDEALPLHEEAVRQTPWSPAAHFFLAETYLGLGRHDEAIRALLMAERVGRIEPRIFFAQLGRAYEGRGDDQRALAAWRIASRQNGDHQWLLHAFEARAAARAGLARDATTAARLAVSLAGVDPLAEATAAGVEAAVLAGCYRQADASCSDPLHAWQYFGDELPSRPAQPAPRRSTRISDDATHSG